MEQKKLRWLILFIISTGTVSMFTMPYMIRTFYDAMQGAMGFTDQQLGTLMSVYGILAMILYFPGGWVADKFSAKKLLIFSMIASGILGLVMATLPSYNTMLVLYVAFGVTTVLTFWAAFIKSVRMLGDSSEQGRLFGFSEAFIGISGAAIGFMGLYLGKILGSSTQGFKWLVVFYSTVAILSGLILVFIFKEKEDDEKASVNLQAFKEIIKIKEVWYITVIIFAAYLLYSSTTYLSPYLVDIYKISVDQASFWGIIRQYAVRLGVPIVFGLLADRFSSTKIIYITFIAIAVNILAFIFLPETAYMLTIAIILMLIVTILATGIRAIYYVTLSESNIPIKFTGTVVGIVAVIGYLPDAFFYPLMGNWLDKLGTTAYTYMFYLILGFIILGVFASTALLKSIKIKNNA